MLVLKGEYLTVALRHPRRANAVPVKDREGRPPPGSNPMQRLER